MLFAKAINVLHMGPKGRVQPDVVRGEIVESQEAGGADEDAKKADKNVEVGEGSTVDKGRQCDAQSQDK